MSGSSRLASAAEPLTDDRFLRELYPNGVR